MGSSLPVTVFSGALGNSLGTEVRTGKVRTMSRTHVSIAIAALCAVSSAQFSDSVTPVNSSLKKGFDSITTADGKTFLGYLAGPECEGRGTGQPGFEKAANYVAAHFKKLGLKSVMPDGSYFQYNDFWRVGVDTKTLAISTDKFKVPTKDIGVSQSGTVDLTSDAVFLHVNGAPQALSAEVEAMVKDKVVVLLNDATRRGFERTLTTAGAKAIVVITDKVQMPSWQGRPSEPSVVNPPVGRLSMTYATASKLFPSDKETLKIRAEKDSVKGARLTGSLTLGATQAVEKIKVMNVVGLLEGSDPTLKSEYIGIGSHLDHLGRVGDTVYWGADDDGSGTTAVMQVAKALATNPIKPKRSVLFMAFYGEEMGLLGSRFLSDNCPLPIENMVAEIQLDMVGRDSYGAQNGDQRRIDKVEENRDTMRLVGSKRISTTLDSIIQEENAAVGFKFKYDGEDVYTRSDHFNFARKGIPIAFFFCGFTPDYHAPTDTVEKINFDKIANTAKLVYLTAHRLGAFEGRLPKNVTPAGGTGGTQSASDDHKGHDHDGN